VKRIIRLRTQWQVVAIALFLSAAGLQAQGPFGIFPWWEGQIAGELNLTDAQKQQVESIQREYRGKMIDGRADLQKAELTLEDTMNADPLHAQGHRCRE